MYVCIRRRFDLASAAHGKANAASTNAIDRSQHALHLLLAIPAPNSTVAAAGFSWSLRVSILSVLHLHLLRESRTRKKDPMPPTLKPRIMLISRLGTHLEGLSTETQTAIVTVNSGIIADSPGYLFGKEEFTVRDSVIMGLVALSSTFGAATSCKLTSEAWQRWRWPQINLMWLAPPAPPHQSADDFGVRSQHQVFPGGHKTFAATAQSCLSGTYSPSDQILFLYTI